MLAVRRPEGPVEPLGRGVPAVAAVGLAGLALAATYQLSGGRIGLPCPLKTMTGLDCPFCGSTRMGAALLGGDVGAAWSLNAPVMLIGLVAAVAVGYQLVAWSLDRARLARLPRWRFGPRAARLVVAGLLLFGVLRNL